MQSESGSSGWFYVTSPGVAPAGPVDEAGLQALLASGHLLSTSSVWKEGQDSWTPIEQVEQLRALLKHAPGADPTPPAAHARTVVASAPRKAAGADDDLAEFEAEIHAIEAEAEGQAGPSTPEELEFEDDDGTWYVWDHELRKYVDKNLAAAAAGVAGMTEADMVYVGDDEEQPSLAAARAALTAADGDGSDDDQGGGEASGLKRPREGSAAAAEAAEHDAAAAELLAAAGGPGKGKKPKKIKALAGAKAEPKPQGWFDLKVNTSVYVTGLPDDVTVPEVCEVFSKYGMIKEDEKGQPRVKIYQDKATGMPKGDALVTFLKEPSVALAIQLLDGAPFRPSMGTRMTVSLAKFEMKGEVFQPKKGPAKNMRKKQLEKQEKRLQWGGFDDMVAAKDVTVVIKHVFEPKDFLEDLLLAEELERDVRAECEKLGAVDKLKLYKGNPEGVVTVKFKAQEAANKCVELMNGRWFGGRQLVAHLHDGVTTYAVKLEESWEEQQARLDAFAKELESKPDGPKEGPS